MGASRFRSLSEWDKDPELNKYHTLYDIYGTYLSYHINIIYYPPFTTEVNSPNILFCYKSLSSSHFISYNLWFHVSPSATLSPIYILYPNIISNTSRHIPTHRYYYILELVQWTEEIRNQRSRHFIWSIRYHSQSNTRNLRIFIPDIDSRVLYNQPQKHTRGKEVSL